MVKEIIQTKLFFIRTSKLGQSHQYSRIRTDIKLECDCCNEEFIRPLGKMDRKRLDNRFFHVCSACDGKRFAQKKSAEKRSFWNRPVDSDLDISRY